MLAWATHGLKRGEDRGEIPAAVMKLPSAKLVAHPELITFEEVEQLRGAGAPVRILDVRTERGYQEARLQGAGAIRVSPNNPVESAASLALPKNEWLVAYCA
jgi:hypothetical protein